MNPILKKGTLMIMFALVYAYTYSINIRYFKVYSIPTLILFTLFQLGFAIYSFLLLYISCINFKNFLKAQWNKRKINNILSKSIHMDKEIQISTIECCICLEEIHDGVKLKCTHVLHRDCLKKYLGHEFTKCPLCIQDLV